MSIGANMTGMPPCDALPNKTGKAEQGVTCASPRMYRLAPVYCIVKKIPANRDNLFGVADMPVLGILVLWHPSMLSGENFWSIF